MNFTKYLNILGKNLVSSARTLKLGHKWILQQPQAHIKMNKEMVNLSKKNNILQWPSQSPEMNPNENQWSKLKMAVYTDEGYQGSWKDSVWTNGLRSLPMRSLFSLNILEKNKGEGAGVLF
jgi:hypothetical protein